MWKALSVIAAILAAGAAFLSYLNKGDLAQERELLATSKSNFADITARAAEVKTAQTDAGRRNGAMEVRRDEALVKQEAEKAKLEAKTQEVAETSARNKELEAEIETAKAQISEFGNVGQLVTLIDQLQADLFTAKNEIATLEGRLASTKVRAEQTAGRIQGFKDLEDRQRNGLMLATSAKIATVHNTWGFAVLNQGDNQGIVSRTKFDVNRGGEKIAELVVTNLEKNRSVCDIVPGSMEPGQMLRPGDRVSVNPESLPKPKAVAPAPGTAVATPGGADLPTAGAPDVMVPEVGVPTGEVDPFGGLDDAPMTPDAPPADAPDPAPADDPFGDL